MLTPLQQIFATPSIALDLGTANTRIYAAEAGRIIEEPSLIRHIRPDNRTQGDDEYLSHLNSRLVSTPLRGGVIIDVNNAITFLRPLIRRTRRWLRPPVSLVCAPTDTTEQEREMLAAAVLQAGAAYVSIIPETWAAAIGAGMDVLLPRAQVLIDIGEGVTDMAVIRDGRILFTHAVRTACSDLQRAIRSAVIAMHRLHLSDADVERLTHEIASLSSTPEAPHWITVCGFDLRRKCRTSIEVTRADVVGAMQPVAQKILVMIEAGLGRLPENIACEVAESGICLTGGGACIHGIDRLIAYRTGLPVHVARDPIHAVINGAIETLRYWRGKRRWWEHIVWPFQRSLLGNDGSGYFP